MVDFVSSDFDYTLTNGDISPQRIDINSAELFVAYHALINGVMSLVKS